MTIADQIVDHLHRTGSVEVRTQSKKYRAMTVPAELTHGALPPDLFFIGKAGALRIGTSPSFSRSLASGSAAITRAALLADRVIERRNRGARLANKEVADG